MKKEHKTVIDQNLFGVGLMEKTYYVGEQAYPIEQAAKASLVLEDSVFTGKGKPFSHLVLATSLQPMLLHTKFVYFGVQITTKDGRKHTGYLAQGPVQINSLRFYDMEKEGKALIEWLNEAIG